MKIVIVAGGTGGHIYPAVSLGEELIKKGHRVLFLGSNDRMEKEIIPEKGLDFIGLNVYSTGGGLVKKAKSVFSLIAAYYICRKIIKSYDCVIGFGNYISVPVVLAGVSLHKKTIIHEQNSFAGRANLFLDKKVDVVIGSYEENKRQFKNKNIFIYGNPQMSRAFNLQKEDDVITEMGLDPAKKTVVIFMGSLGSESMTDILLEYFDIADGNYQVVYATGNAYYNYVSDKIRKADFIRYFKRIDGIKVMKNADLLISRAGATTLAEIMAIGMPSILIPSPYVPNNHQYYNAKALADKGAAVLIEEKDLTARSLKQTVDSLLAEPDKISKMALAASALANRDVMKDIMRVVERND